MHPVRHTLVATAAVLAASAGLPAIASAQPSGTLSVTSGKAGALRLGASTEAQVRRAWGAPRTADTMQDYSQKAYRALTWRCGSACTMLVQLRDDRLALVLVDRDAGSGGTGLRTAAGTTVGTTKRTARRKERKAFVNGCTSVITKRSGGRTLEVGAGSSRDANRVSRIALYDRNAFTNC
jgi:hypothetical protein